MTQPPPFKRKLTAIMFTDIVGYTALMQTDKPKARQLVERHRQIIEPCVASHEGTILQYFGDRTLCTFGSAIEAVNSAVEIHLAFWKDEEISLRIGIHVGDVAMNGDEIFGDGVNVASRLMPLAAAGGICVSERVYDDIKNQPGIETQSLGEMELKNVKRSMEVFALVGEGLAVPEHAGRPVIAPKQVGERRIEEKAKEITDKKILIIDDEVGFTQNMKLALEQTGAYEVMEENDATRALATAGRFKPDLILLDVVMPEIDGGKVAFKIQSEDDLRDIPIVFLTAAVTQKEEGMIGGRPFIAKPVTMKKLLHTIEQNLER